MVELFAHLIPEWIVKHRVPMSEPMRQHWERMRRRGILSYLMLWAVGMGGLLFAFDVGWDVIVEHTKIDSFFAGFCAGACVLISLIVGTINWHLNENRYRHSQAL